MKIFLGYYDRYGQNLNSHDLLKFVAIILMIIDHVGYYLFPDHLWFRVIGRMCIPIWFFLIGYSRPKEFSWVLIYIGTALTLFKYLTIGDSVPLNIFFTLSITRAFILFLEQKEISNLELAFYTSILVLWTFPTIFMFEYGPIGALFSLAAFYQKKNTHRETTYILWTIALMNFLVVQSSIFSFSYVQVTALILGCSLVIIALNFYNFKKFYIINPLSNVIRYIGRNAIYIYPLHIIIFILLRLYS
jgi:TraX protein